MEHTPVGRAVVSRLATVRHPNRRSFKKNAGTTPTARFRAGMLVAPDIHAAK